MPDPMPEAGRRESHAITWNGSPREQVMAAFTAAAVVDADRLRADPDATVEQHS
jgi:hypothetical protein